MTWYSVAGVSRAARQVNWASVRRTESTCALTASRCGSIAKSTYVSDLFL